MELPSQRVALELFVSEVEEEVAKCLLRTRSDLDPVVRAAAQLQIARDLVELAPSGSNGAEPTLATVPALVIDTANPITPGIPKTNVGTLPLGELRKLPRV